MFSVKIIINDSPHNHVMCTDNSFRLYRLYTNMHRECIIVLSSTMITVDRPDYYRITISPS
jgi:hypothetical protein